MHIEILVEDESTQVVVKRLLKRLSPDPPDATWRVQQFRGREAMWRNLHGTLYSIAAGRYADAVLVLLDQDRSDCIELKQEAIAIATDAGMIRNDGSLAVSDFVVRINETELESWFLGDAAAVRSAYPRVSRRARFASRPIESIEDAWETLHRVLQRYGYYPNFMPKIEVAKNIAPHLSLVDGVNASHSFRVVLRSLQEFIEHAQRED